MLVDFASMNNKELYKGRSHKFSPNSKRPASLGVLSGVSNEPREYASNGRQGANP